VIASIEEPQLIERILARTGGSRAGTAPHRCARSAHERRHRFRMIVDKLVLFQRERRAVLGSMTPRAYLGVA
jgi:hypothetical protein